MRHAPIQWTEEGREALRGAYALARRTGARLRVLTVVKPRVVMDTETEAAMPPRPGRDFDRVVGEHRVEAEVGARKAVAQVLGDDGEIEVDAFVGDPGDTLVELSEYLDLLVSGSRGYGPVRAALLGGVARRSKSCSPRRRGPRLGLDGPHRSSHVRSPTRRRSSDPHNHARGSAGMRRALPVEPVVRRPSPKFPL